MVYRRLSTFATLLSLSLAGLPAAAQDGIDGGRWVPRGTFAISNLPANEIRERSYARAGKERARILTFLPGMTIVYQTAPSPRREGYLVGLTHSGIPVEVLESELSTNLFSDLAARDVVVHRTHDGCRDLACGGDPFKIGIGESYRIVDEKSDREQLSLINYNQKEVVYSREAFEDLETRGYLTKHRDRVNPRWTISDGYAESLSTGCGESRSSISDLVVSEEAYHQDPASWGINDPRWSMKAIEVFDLGIVELDPATGNYIGQLASTIEGQSETPVAIDLTVFSYRDSQWQPSFYKFAGLLQIVHCEDSATGIGRVRPQYVRDAVLYFDMQQGDAQEQEFPLPEVVLPRQLSQEAQEQLFRVTRRSFYYSINSAGAYEALFEDLSESVIFPTAVANIIARLNASCAEHDREKCRRWSEAPPG